MLESAGHHIRAIDPRSPAEVALVASRMRQTLVEVLGEERGSSLYTMEWLEARVRWHLDPARCAGQVFLSVDSGDRITGHTIVRVQLDELFGRQLGLFSTVFVDPADRGQGVGTNLILRGEQWMLEQGMTFAATYTAEGNSPLIRLMEKLGYRIAAAQNEMVALGKPLSGR